MKWFLGLGMATTWEVVIVVILWSTVIFLIRKVISHFSGISLLNPVGSTTR